MPLRVLFDLGGHGKPNELSKSCDGRNLFFVNGLQRIFMKGRMTRRLVDGMGRMYGG